MEKKILTVFLCLFCFVYGLFRICFFCTKAQIQMWCSGRNDFFRESWTWSVYMLQNCFLLNRHSYRAMSLGLSLYPFPNVRRNLWYRAKLCWHVPFHLARALSDSSCYSNSKTRTRKVDQQYFYKHDDLVDEWVIETCSQLY